jgi:hypothetical protein
MSASTVYIFPLFLFVIFQVVEIEMPIDKTKNQRKGFCFVTFDNEQVVHELLKNPKQTIGGKEVKEVGCSLVVLYFSYSHIIMMSTSVLLLILMMDTLLPSKYLLNLNLVFTKDK